MSLAGTTAIVFWILALAVAGWALAAGAPRRRRRRGGMGRDLYCRYCAWPVGWSSRFEPIRWRGAEYCSLVCLRHDAELLEREESQA